MLRLWFALCLVLPLAGAPSPAAAKPHKKPARDRAQARRPPPRPPVPPGAKPAPKAVMDRLSRGYWQYQRGEYEAARRELQPLESKKLLSSDYVLYLLAQSELLAGAPGPALGHFRALERLGGGRFVVIARYRAADALYALGRLDEARRAYEAALKSASDDDIDPAVARFRIAEALGSSGDKAAAVAAFRRVYDEQPFHPLADRALERVRAMDPAATVSPAERITRAKILTANRGWARALEELDLVPAEVPPALRDEADYWIGMTHFKMRRDYPLAAGKLLGLWQRLPTDERKVDALFHGARAQSRGDADDKAIEGYREVVRRFPHSKLAAEASFLIGWLDFNRGRYAEALPGLEETLHKYPSSSFEDDARWYLGFSRWQMGDAAGALKDFQLLEKHPGALTGGKGSYWKARALEKLGRKEEALGAWRGLVTEYPFSYYAIMARLQLREHGVPVGPFGDGRRGETPPLGALEPKLAADPLVARVDELIQAGLTVEAGVELKRVEGELTRKYGAARALPLLFDRYLRTDDFHRPHQLAESHSGAALRMDPQASPMARAWWEEVYPRAYRAFVEKYAPTGENPAYYLYTIMQKESAYNPHDVSYADAIGLLQMIPPTSRKVGARIDFAYTDDVLYDPEGNIRFGAWYIGHLLQKFKGQIALGAGSYNAGPQAMMKWLRKNGDRALDEFVELCPYTQTREYMKKVLDIYSRYVYLYDRQDYLPDNKIDRAFIENDVDY